MQKSRAYLELTKPGITVFIGVTAAAGFITAAGGLHSLRGLALTITATMLMSGGAAALNQLSERCYDGMMRRTASRPIPAGVIEPRAAARFAWTLSLAGLLLALLTLPPAAAVFLVLCHISYVNVYTPLKRRTPLCTLAGAIPGALPVLAGWTAAGQPLDVSAFALTGVLFMWQIPHFLAIGWMAREDYRSAGCPMLSVVEDTGRATARVSLMYTVAMLVCAVILGITSSAGMIYLVPALTIGGAYVWFALRFARSPGPVLARSLFFSSLLVLPLLLSALVADLIIG